MLPVLIWFSLFIPQSDASGHAFHRWELYAWHRLASEQYIIEGAGITIDVTYYTERMDGPSSRSHLEEVAQTTYDYLSSQISIGPGSARGPCFEWRLVVYDVAQEFIHSRSALYWYPWTDTQQRLYGAYDSLNTDSPNTAVIVLRSDLSEEIHRQTLAHELTHYWYDMCVSDGSPGESYAQSAEDLYD